MAFYEGVDEEIYEGGDHYVPMQQFRLNKFVPTVKTTPTASPTSTSYGIPAIYPAGTASYAAGPDYRGGGLHGNLDLSNTKTFTKQVWSDVGPPGQFGWVEKQVKGYYNPSTGHYQTFEGKNINHLGLEVPTIAGMIFDKDFGKGPKPGDIKGTFTDGWDSGIENIKEGWDEEKDKWSEVLGINKAKAFFKGKKDKEDLISTAVDTEENQPNDGGITTITTNQNQTGSGDGWSDANWGDSPGGEFDTTSANAGTSEGWSQPENQGTTPGAGLHADYNQGGRVGFFDSISGMRDALKAMGYDWIDAADDLTVRQIFNSEKGTWTASDVWRPGKKEGGRIYLNLGGLASIL